MMNEYQEFLELLETLKKQEKKPTLLLHSCCGPCSTAVLEKLVDSFEITILYYNPNIYPMDEYYKRLGYQKEVLKHFQQEIKILEEPEAYAVYQETIKDTGNLGEGSIRCYKCYEFRIKHLAQTAKRLNFDYFTTVMSVSPYKNSTWINEIGKRCEEEINHQSKFLYSNFKKEEGYKRSIALSKEFNLYRQDYCGCEYSIKEHEMRVQNKLEKETSL